MDNLVRLLLVAALVVVLWIGLSALYLLAALKRVRDGHDADQKPEAP
jgi:hypothetical protein